MNTKTPERFNSLGGRSPGDTLVSRSPGKQREWKADARATLAADQEKTVQKIARRKARLLETLGVKEVAETYGRTIEMEEEIQRGQRQKRSYKILGASGFGQNNNFVLELVPVREDGTEIGRPKTYAIIAEGFDFLDQAPVTNT